jgi:hypothetical protein
MMYTRNNYLSQASGITVGPDGSIYVGEWSTASLRRPSIFEFAPNADGNVAPAHTVIVHTSNCVGCKPTAGSTMSLAMGKDGYVYDTFLAMNGTWGSEGVQAFAQHAQGLATPVKRGDAPAGNSQNAMATCDGTVYVAGLQWIAARNGYFPGVGIYRLPNKVMPLGSPSVQPEAILTGPHTMLTKSGNVYVFNMGTRTMSGHKVPKGTNTVYVFAAGATGDVAPSRAITMDIDNATISEYGAMTVGAVP